MPYIVYQPPRTIGNTVARDRLLPARPFNRPAIVKSANRPSLDAAQGFLLPRYGLSAAPPAKQTLTVPPNTRRVPAIGLGDDISSSISDFFDSTSTDINIPLLLAGVGGLMLLMLLTENKRAVKRRSKKRSKAAALKKRAAELEAEAA